MERHAAAGDVAPPAADGAPADAAVPAPPLLDLLPAECDAVVDLRLPPTGLGSLEVAVPWLPPALLAATTHAVVGFDEARSSDPSWWILLESDRPAAWPVIADQIRVRAAATGWECGAETSPPRPTLRVRGSSEMRVEIVPPVLGRPPVVKTVFRTDTTAAAMPATWIACIELAPGRVLVAPEGDLPRALAVADGGAGLGGSVLRSRLDLAPASAWLRFAYLPPAGGLSESGFPTDPLGIRGWLDGDADAKIALFVAFPDAAAAATARNVADGMLAAAVAYTAALPEAELVPIRAALVQHDPALADRAIADLRTSISDYVRMIGLAVEGEEVVLHWTLSGIGGDEVMRGLVGVN
jgi:hypothetical protein